jgi:Fe2+ or Zn2+ uptake regulation protein
MHQTSQTVDVRHAEDDSVLKSIAADLDDRGLRPTPARRLILSYLRHSAGHPTVEQLHAQLAEHGHDLGIATVYQNLSRLAETDLVTRFLDSRGLMRFDANQTRHHHLLCASCGRITDLDVDADGSRAIGRLISRLSSEGEGWLIRETQLELKGVCPACLTTETIPPSE